MDTPNLVSPVSFTTAMEDHWVNRLGNTPSDSLRQLWRTMGSAFGNAILAFDKVSPFSDAKPTWTVLNPPTGTGKSQGTCVYSAMVAKTNRSLPAGVSPVGILVVTHSAEVMRIADRIIALHDGRVAA